MKALIYQGEKDLHYMDADDPTPHADQRLIRIDSVGICGSDMHAFLGHDERRPAPLILGHEAAGTIIEGPETGRRVTINPLVSCGTCQACLEGRENICADRQIISMPPREGAFAELVAITNNNLVTVPDHVSFEKAALAEPLACGWHAVRLASEAHHGSHNGAKALAIGGGAIGLGAALSLKAAGIEDVTLIEPNDARRNFVKEKTGLNAVKPEQLGDSEMFDIIIDGVGIEPTRALSSKRAVPGGIIAHIGLGSSADGLDIRRMTLQEITFIGCYTYTAEDFRQTAAAIFDGRLGNLNWTENRPLEEGQQAFEDILSANVAAPKVILKP